MIPLVTSLSLNFLAYAVRLSANERRTRQTPNGEYSTSSAFVSQFNQKQPCRSVPAMLSWRAGGAGTLRWLVLCACFVLVVSGLWSGASASAGGHEGKVYFSDPKENLLLDLTASGASTGQRLSFFGEEGNILAVNHSLTHGGLVKIKPHREGRTAVTVFDPRNMVEHELTLFGEMGLTLGSANNDPHWVLEYDMRDMSHPLLVPEQFIGLHIGTTGQEDWPTPVRIDLYSTATPQWVELTSTAGTLRILGAPWVTEEVRIAMQAPAPFHSVETYLDDVDVLTAEAVPGINGDSLTIFARGGRAVTSGACTDVASPLLPYVSGNVCCTGAQTLTVVASQITVDDSVTMESGALSFSSMGGISIDGTVASVGGTISMSATTGTFSVSGDITSDTGSISLDPGDTQLVVVGSITTSDASIDISSFAASPATPVASISGQIAAGLVGTTRDLSIVVTAGSASTLGLDLSGADLSATGDFFIDISMGPGGELEDAIFSSDGSSLLATGPTSLLDIRSVGSVVMLDTTLFSNDEITLDARGPVSLTRGSVTAAGVLSLDGEASDITTGLYLDDLPLEADTLDLSGSSDLGAGVEAIDVSVGATTSAILSGVGVITGTRLGGMLVLTDPDPFGASTPSVTIEGAADTTGISFVVLASVVGFPGVDLAWSGVSTTGNGAGFEGSQVSISNLNSMTIVGTNGNHAVLLDLFTVDTVVTSVGITGSGANTGIYLREVVLEADQEITLDASLQSQPLVTLPGLFGVLFDNGAPSQLRAPTIDITGTIVPAATVQSVGVQLSSWSFVSNDVTVTGFGGPGGSVSVGTVLEGEGALDSFDINSPAAASFTGIASSSPVMGSANDGCGVCCTAGGTLVVSNNFDEVSLIGGGGSGSSAGISLQEFETSQGTNCDWTLNGTGSQACNTGPCPGVVVFDSTISHSTITVLGTGGCGPAPQNANVGIDTLEARFPGTQADLSGIGGCGSNAAGLIASNPNAIQFIFAAGSSLVGTGGEAILGVPANDNHGLVVSTPNFAVQNSEPLFRGTGGSGNGSHGILFTEAVVFGIFENTEFNGSAFGGFGSSGLVFDDGFTVDTLSTQHFQLVGTTTGQGESSYGVHIQGGTARFEADTQLFGDSFSAACPLTCHGVRADSIIEVVSGTTFLFGTAHTGGAGISLLSDVRVTGGSPAVLTFSGIGRGLPGVDAPFSTFSGDGSFSVDGTSDIPQELVLGGVSWMSGPGCAFEHLGAMTVGSFSFDNTCDLQMSGGTYIEGVGNNGIDTSGDVFISGPFELGNSHSSTFSIEASAMLTLEGTFSSGQAVEMVVAPTGTWENTDATSFFGFCSLLGSLGSAPADLTLGGFSGSASTIAIEGGMYDVEILQVLDDVSVNLEAVTSVLFATEVDWRASSTNLGVNAATYNFQSSGSVQFVTTLTGTAVVQFAASDTIFIGSAPYTFGGTMRTSGPSTSFLEGTLIVTDADSLLLSGDTPAEVLDLVVTVAISGTDIHLNGLGYGCLEVHGGLMDVSGCTIHMSLGQTVLGVNSPCLTQDAFRMRAPAVEVRLTGTSLVLEQDGPVQGEIFLFISDGNANYVGEFAGLPDGSPIVLPQGEAMSISYSSSFLGLGTGSDISLIPVPAPVAVADSGYTVVLFDPLTVSAANGLLDNDIFSFGDDGNFIQVLVSSVTQPSFGTVVVEADGSFTYTPTGGFAPSDQFTYRIEDNFGLTSNSATVTLTLIALPTPSATNSPTSSSSITSAPSVTPSMTPTPTVSVSRSRGPNIGPSALPSAGSVGSSPEPVPPTPLPSSSPSVTSAPTRSVQDICLIDSSNVLCVNDEPVLTVSGPDVVITGPDPDVVRQVDNDDVVSLVLDVTPTDAYQPGDEAVLCFAVTEELQDDSCLGFINEEKNPPEWECEDSCIEEDSGRACGTTRHFTNFAILLDGGKYGGATCTSTEEDFIFDEWWQDLLLALALVLFVGCCLIVLAALLCTPVGARLLYGEEGTRIRRARSAGKETASSV